MLRALLKKDFLRFFSAFTSKRGKKNKKGQTKSGKGSAVGMIVLWVVVFFSLGMAFAGMCHMFSASLLPAGLSWLYFALVGMSGFLLSVIGNGFTSYSGLFKAKDNELLLSMPIPEKYILFSRMCPIFIMSVVYSAIYIIPAVIVHNSYEEYRSASVVINGIVLIIVNAFLVTAISALFGWLIALISKRIKNKSAATTIFTLLFLGIYYYVYFNIQKYLGKLLQFGMEISESMQSSVIAWPIHQFGLAASGDYKALLAYFIFAAVVFIAVYRMLSISFNKIVTSTEKKQDYKYEEDKQAQVELKSPRKALIKKELSKFTSSPTYMINCGLGILFLVAAAVMLVIKAPTINEVLAKAQLSLPGVNIQDYIPLICTAVMIFGIGSIDITAPSISLEGKNIWILKAMPVKTADVFYAKEMLQYYMSIPPMVILFAAMMIVFKLEYGSALFVAVVSVVYLELHAMMGLVYNLKFPKLDWTNEVQPIKQSLSVMLSLFGGWILVLVLGAAYWFVLKDMITPDKFLIVIMVVMAVLLRVVQKWLRTKGAEIFEAL